jgi:hypothetical protein
MSTWALLLCLEMLFVAGVYTGLLDGEYDFGGWVRRGLDKVKEFHTQLSTAVHHHAKCRHRNRNIWVSWPVRQERLYILMLDSRAMRETTRNSARTRR